MYRFYINNIENEYNYEELARLFLADDEFEVLAVNIADMPAISQGKIKLRHGAYIINNRANNSDANSIKREMYEVLAMITGIRPGWGILTGVRPLKLAYEIYTKSNYNINAMIKMLKDTYLVSDDKADILREILEYQISEKIIDTKASSSKYALYVHIPFCPTRCEYCSFATNVARYDEIEEYLKLLIKEIEYTGRLYLSEHASTTSQHLQTQVIAARDIAYRKEIESVYIGGGTPTCLDSSQLGRLVSSLCENFGIEPGMIEFTVEAGRPDTIAKDKLDILSHLGVSRISINPQSMKDETLRQIGREHSADAIREAYELARRFDFEVINTDLIAGLPGEDLEDFKLSLEEMISMDPGNITVHTLSVKRGSRLRENDPEYYRRNTEVVTAMVEYARHRLSDAGYIPYYIYRQKHQMGALENIGYCKRGLHSLYNIRIMEEKQSIIALGAGAIGKVYYPDEDRLERIANVSNYKIYAERFDEMLERKKLYFE